MKECRGSVISLASIYKIRVPTMSVGCDLCHRLRYLLTYSLWLGNFFTADPNAAFTGNTSVEISIFSISWDMRKIGCISCLDWYIAIAHA